MNIDCIALLDQSSIVEMPAVEEVEYSSLIPCCIYPAFNFDIMLIPYITEKTKSFTAKIPIKRIIVCAIVILFLFVRRL